MEIINIEKQTFDEMMSRFELFTQKVKAICSKYKIKTMNDWLDNQDVCLLLSISPRTLQTYRDTGRLSFSRINHKIYYKNADIEKLLDDRNNKIFTKH